MLSWPRKSAVQAPHSMQLLDTCVRERRMLETLWLMPSRTCTGLPAKRFWHDVSRM